MSSKPRPKPITIEQYQQLSSDYSGLCLACGEEAPNVEPDARNYPCDACGGKNTVCGPDEWLLKDLVQ